MRRFCLVLMTLLLLSALFCGCGADITPSESTADATTAPTTTAPTTAATTEATTTAPTTTEVTTTVATTTAPVTAAPTTGKPTVTATTTATTAVPTTVPVTRPTFDPSIPVATWPTTEGLRHDGAAYFTFEDFEYKVYPFQAKVEVLRYIGNATDVTIPYEVQYVWNDTLYTQKVSDASPIAFYNTSVKTVRWHTDTPFSPSNSLSIFDKEQKPTSLYLPRECRGDSESILNDRITVGVYWGALVGSVSEPLHLYLIKGAPLTEMLYDERMTNPYGWELDFSEEGTYCFYKQKDGKDDQPVYFHVAESFE